MDEEVTLTKNPWVDLGIVGAVAFGAGLGLGYILWRRPKPYILHAVPESVDMDIHEEDLQEIKANHPSSEISVAPLVEERIKKSMTTVHEEVEEAVVAQNVFAEDDEDWDYEKEVENRTEREPYVLHRDEFFEDEKNYTQLSYTYFAGDNILVDEEETPVYNHGHVTGKLLFGHGSGDQNVVYIRNDKRRTEYEVIKHTGTYSEEVLGLQIEDNERVKDIKHSNVRKFRDSD